MHLITDSFTNFIMALSISSIWPSLETNYALTDNEHRQQLVKNSLRPVWVPDCFFGEPFLIPKLKWFFYFSVLPSEKGKIKILRFHFPHLFLLTLNCFLLLFVIDVLKEDWTEYFYDMQWPRSIWNTNCFLRDIILKEELFHNLF